MAHNDEWLICPGCYRDVLASDLCECDHQSGPRCLYRCCEIDHPVGRLPLHRPAA